MPAGSSEPSAGHEHSFPWGRPPPNQAATRNQPTRMRQSTVGGVPWGSPPPNQVAPRQQPTRGAP
eukprot:7829624-Lingulodinium_polyedra.AAC.1